MRTVPQLCTVQPADENTRVNSSSGKGLRVSLTHVLRFSIRKFVFDAGFEFIMLGLSAIANSDCEPAAALCKLLWRLATTQT